MTTRNASSMTKPRHQKDRCRIEQWRTRHPKRQILLEMLEARILRAVDVGVNAPDAVDEGETLTLDGWYTSGDGASSAPTLTVSWGDGVTDSYSLAENTSACVAYAADHIYADDGSYAVAVPLYDDTGSDRVSLQIDWGDDTTDTVSGSPDGSFAHGHAYADDGSYGVTATATYSNGGSAANSDSVAVTDPASETWSLSCTLSDTTAEVSQSVSMSCDFGHPGASETVTLQIDWGDGSSDTATGTPDGSIVFDHAYPTEGSYDVRATATDGDYDVASYGPETVIVNGVADESPSLAPTLSATTVDEDETLWMTGSFGHPETSETVTLQIDWGDDTIEGAIGFPGGSLDRDHAYSEPGTFSVQVTATDDDGDQAVFGQYVSVLRLPYFTSDQLTVEHGYDLPKGDQICDLKPHTARRVGVPVQFEFVSGHEDGLFGIDASSGVVYLQKKALEATRDVYDLVVKVSADGQSDETDLRIHFVPAVGIIGDFHAVKGREFDSIEIQFYRFQRDWSAPLTVGYGVLWNAQGSTLEPTDFADNAAGLGSSVLIPANSPSSEVITLKAIKDEDTVDSQTEQVDVIVYPGTVPSYIPCKYEADVQEKKKLDIGAFSRVTLRVVEGVTTFAPDGFDENGSPTSHVVASNDVAQGSVGDCWMLAAAMALADSDPDYVQSTLISEQNVDGGQNAGGGLSGWIVHLYEIQRDANGELVYTGEQKEILIQGEILSGGMDMAQLSGDIDSVGRVEVWPIVLERAWAQLLAGPPAVGDIDEGGYARVAWYGLTGEIPQASNYFNANGKSQAEIEAELLRMYDTQGQIVINTKPNPPGMDFIILPSGGKAVGGHSHTASMSWNTDPATGDRVLNKIELSNPWGEDYPVDLFPQV